MGWGGGLFDHLPYAIHVLSGSTGEQAVSCVGLGFSLEVIQHVDEL
jgi:hypothetical protein